MSSHIGNDVGECLTDIGRDVARPRGVVCDVGGGGTDIASDVQAVHNIRTDIVSRSSDIGTDVGIYRRLEATHRQRHR